MSSIDWVQFDQEGAVRKRFRELHERTDYLRSMIDQSEWSWSEFEEMYDISWIYHENGLEGVVLTYPEIKSAVDNQIVSDVSLLPMYQHIKDQKWCIDQMRTRSRQRRSTITIGFLKELHGVLLGDEANAGTYRKDVPIHRTYFHEISQPQKIHKTLVDVLEYLKTRHRDLHPIELASNVHCRFMHSFPFSKFSGTIGRLLINFVLSRAGYLPVVIHATDRQRYYEALAGSEGKFRKFLLAAMDNSLENALRFFNTHGQSATGRRKAV